MAGAATVSAAILPGFFRAPVPPMSWSADRDGRLVEIATGERVLHLGCTALPHTEMQLAEGNLLHQQLMAVADDVLGVDIDEPGLRRLESALGGSYLLADATDAEALAPAVAFAPTMLLAADVIEHVRDAGAFLDALRALAGRCAQPPRLAISTPNALSLRTPALAVVGMEMMHPDHRAVYSPKTLTTALRASGFEPQEWRAYSISLGGSVPRRLFDAVAHGVSRCQPALADGLLVVASPSP